jgi:dipeptide/tripeptide permease
VIVADAAGQQGKGGRKKRSEFPPLYWLVVMFEFFERGAYYGMMSVLSVYMVDELAIPKQDVGLIKGTIQPLLYFLPILSGALADRFGYRRMLMIAFALLGGGYFLTSQATEYAAVFLSLVVMGLGAGIFKPIISGSIARCTDESNSTLGFGIFYWSINLGAFLFPLGLVPALRYNFGYEWVIIASAICTGAMLLPTLLFFREPPRDSAEQAAEDAGAAEDEAAEKKPGLLQTMANAFEIIYSPLILLGAWMRRSAVGVVIGLLLLGGLLAYGSWDYSEPEDFQEVFAARAYPAGDGVLVVRGEPNLCAAEPFALQVDAERRRIVLELLQPDDLDAYAAAVLEALDAVPFAPRLDAEQLARWRDEAVERTIFEVEYGPVAEPGYALEERGGGRLALVLDDPETWHRHQDAVLAGLMADPRTAAIEPEQLADWVSRAGKRPFFWLYVGLLLLAGLIMQRLALAFRAGGGVEKLLLMGGSLALLYAIIWLLPGLSLFARILTSVLSLTLLSLYAIDYKELGRFTDHLRFLVMVVIYSGFWVLYFQMFDSVLWYVQAYVDPSALNQAVNDFLGWFGFEFKWRFDVEGVTYINAGTIILLQLFISRIVKKTKALPTMVVGICLGTAGMAILAISTGIWVFLAGIVLFSIGEMTAHPKFIAYVGQTAPRSRVAMYMGYLFLYGVIGSSVGGVVGAKLYVKVVDQMNQPQTLWLIFAGFGVATVIGLLLYNRFLADKDDAPAVDEE